MMAIDQTRNVGRARRLLAGPAGSVVSILMLFLALGAVNGWLWEHWWSPTVGVVVDGEWFTSELGEQELFSGTGLYVALASVTGLALGLLCAVLWHRTEVVTLAAITAGSVLAAAVMWAVGTSLGPPSQSDLAQTVAEGTRLPSALDVAGFSAFTAFPLGALLGVLVVFLGFSRDSTD